MSHSLNTELETLTKVVPYYDSNKLRVCSINLKEQSSFLHSDIYTDCQVSLSNVSDIKEEKEVVESKHCICCKCCKVEVKILCCVLLLVLTFSVIAAVFGKRQYWV